MLLAGRCGQMVEAILNSPTKRYLRIDDSVCFGDDSTVYGTRRPFRGCPMVFDCFAHRRDFRRREMRSDERITCKNDSRIEMMTLASVAQASVVKCRNRVNHGRHDRIMLGKPQTLGNDRPYMIDAVRRVEFRIVRNDRSFDIRNEFRLNVLYDDATVQNSLVKWKRISLKLS